MMKFQPGWIQTDDKDFEKRVAEIIAKVLPNYLKNQGFTARKLTDTPTDGLQVVNRNYTNLYGSITGAPQTSIVGQKFFATDLNYLVTKDSNYRWRNGSGSIVG